jgi:hypothetical protein
LESKMERWLLLTLFADCSLILMRYRFAA